MSVSRLKGLPSLQGNISTYSTVGPWIRRFTPFSCQFHASQLYAPWVPKMPATFVQWMFSGLSS